LPRRKSILATENHISDHRSTTHNRTSPPAPPALAHRRLDPLSLSLSLSLCFTLSPDLPLSNPVSASPTFSAPIDANPAPQELPDRPCLARSRFWPPNVASYSSGTGSPSIGSSLCSSLSLSLSDSISLSVSLSPPISPSRTHSLPLPHCVPVKRKKKNRRRKNEEKGKMGRCKRDSVHQQHFSFLVFIVFN
jgi:hypothetical protein